MHNASATAARKTNRLSREKSPYLLQHQHNPVDWFAWGEAAFARARTEQKPIFLSIGYSTCHWCHVMERESFESESIAEILNRSFVCIKVDREERPDVDKIYMTFVQATTGQGGWPLNVFLTPELKPFYGGTYFPPHNRYGRPGFPHLLEQIAEVWTAKRAELEASAAEMAERLRTVTSGAGPAGAGEGSSLDSMTVISAGELLKQHYDPANGGFGAAPKFPQPSHPQFLLRHAKRSGDTEAVKMVLHTCDRMAAGGIHDQLGGGFARYSVDTEWLVPHFEKMLYDNAQLAQLYLDAFLVSGETRYERVVRSTLDYVLRDMTHPEGGFYSAEDADSEGHEGKFYCWTLDEMGELLTPEETEVAVAHYGVTAGGNFVDHSHPTPLRGQNVLSVANVAAATGRENLLASATEKLRAARAKRVRPHRDDKVLVSWNGLMLGALARAGAVLREPRYLEAARRNMAFVRTQLWNGQTLYHRWRDGECDSVELLEGHAFYLSGLVELYQATLDSSVLALALDIAKAMLRDFYDAERGGFWQSPAGAGDLILRLKEDYDGAEPSGNAVAILALLQLAKITAREEFEDAARKSLAFFIDRLESAPQAVPYMLQAADFALQEPLRAVVAGDPGSPEVPVLIHTLQSVYQPNKVILGTTAPVELFARTLAGPRPLVYLCTGTACQPPTSDPKQLQDMIGRGS
jgi:uncharacterized protein YyaL (SSP411 family)